MIRTIKWHLAKDLVRAAALAAVAFTLVMTVFAVIEPLREEGLSSRQALKLFGFSMPVMVSLTFPIAALFAAAMVYGRFAQDNELMACRASGICPLSLLTPAVWLGLIVTAVTLLLGLYVGPRLLWRAQDTVKNDLRHIAFQALRSRGRFEFGSRVIHADHVDPETGWLEGVVILDTSRRDDAAYLVASRARLDLLERDGEPFVVFEPRNYVLRRQGGGAVWTLEGERLRRGDLPDITEDDPKFYDWTRLMSARSSPQELPVVRREMRRIRQKLSLVMFCQEFVRALKAGGKYPRLDEFSRSGGGGRSGWVEISASSAAGRKGNEVFLGTAGPSGERTVILREHEGERPTRVYEAREATLRTQWSEYYGAGLITVMLRDVRIRDLDPLPQQRERRKEEIGPYVVPADVVRRSEQLDLASVREHPERYGFAKYALGLVGGMERRTIQRLQAKVTAEIHLRLAYGLSCLLMVMLGGALGLLFRGGQMLAAFAISAMPASAVIVLLFMGKELIKNPGVPQGYGIGVIWGGIAALALATAYVYVVHMRR